MKFSKILPIQSFLEQDFYKTGYRDGFDHHTEIVMNARIKGLEATFLFRLDLAIEQKRKRLLEIRNQSNKSEKFPESIASKIDPVAKELEAMIGLMEKEKELSPGENGWLMKSIDNYREGFLKGAEAYRAGKLDDTAIDGLTDEK